MEEFIEKMAEIMEVDVEKITGETDFRKACDFDSLKGFSVLCMLEDDYDVEVKPKDFLGYKTINDLYALVK